ncbi:hypothetical protein FRC05_010017 [Tulasnella sp. 425]|nr:hypothetical protein FRC05_010017 [Tulasnella sp. 425]
MLDDKYIGLSLAVCSSLAIGTSFIITKKGLNDAARRDSPYGNASDDRAYLRNPIWWAGMATLVLGEVANFAAYTFAPPILVTPLGALTVLIGAVLASILLKEELGHLGRIGCTLSLAGSLIIVLHAPEDKPIQTVDEILNYALQPAFMLYCFCVLVFSFIMIFAVAPRYGRRDPVVYISICSLVGSVSVMSIKGFGIAVKLTLSGNNQFTHPSTYVFMIVTGVCIMVQMNYFNKALDLFSTNVVNPLYYVGFTTCTIVASIILFQGFNTTDTANSVSLVTGFIIIFIGVHLLNISRKPDVPPPPSPTSGEPHPLPHEHGFVNSRLSLSGGGRLSIDSTWSREAAPLSAGGHGRRTSAGARGLSGFTYPSRLGDEEQANGGVGLTRLREDPKEEDVSDDSDADERTGLRSGGRSPMGGASGGGHRSLARGSAPSTPVVTGR